MVTRHLKNLFLLLSCISLLITTQGMAAVEPEIPLFKEYQGQIYVTTQPNQVVLGEKVTLTIRGESLEPSFNKINWSEFTKYFVIYDIDIGFDRIKVQLYPIKSGEFKIAGQKAGLITLPDISVTIDPNPEVSIEWQRPSSTLYIHQNATWKARITLKNIANKATFETANNKVNKQVITRVQALPVESIESTKGKTDTLVASYEVKDWTGNRSKRVTLNSPVITVKNTSNRRWHFFDQPQSVSLNPLPSFLPMTVSVGEIEWSNMPFDSLQATGELNYWSWELTGKGITKAYLNSVAHQLIGQIRHNPAIEWLSDSREINTEFTTDGLQSSLKLRVPYRLTQPGLINFPALQLTFFNPGSGMLVTKTHPVKTLVAIPQWLIWLAQWMLLVIALLASYLALLGLKQARVNLQLKRQIKRSKDVQALWSALYQWRCQQQTSWYLFKTKNAYSQSSRKPTELYPVADCSIHSQSTGQWIDWYQSQFGDCKPFIELMQAFDHILYASHQEVVPLTEWPQLNDLALKWANSLNWWQTPLKTLSGLFKKAN